MIVFNNERERERERERDEDRSPICITFVPFFPSHIFQIQKIHLPQKEAQKQTQRVSVLSREGSLNLSHKEREKIEREHSKSDFYRAEQKESFD